jgi:hypothetical protein
MNSFIQIQNINECESLAICCGYTPLNMIDESNINKLLNTFNNQNIGDRNNNIRNVCNGCQIGSLWKLGTYPENDILFIYCSNIYCSIYNTLKFKIKKNT